MSIQLIISLVIILVVAGLSIALYVVVKSSEKKDKTIKTKEKAITALQSKLAEEILRAKEKEEQVQALLKFQKQDSGIVIDMTKHIEILKDAKTEEDVKDEIIKISDDIRDIYNS